jgi:hypothetical protein
MGAARGLAGRGSYRGLGGRFGSDPPPSAFWQSFAPIHLTSRDPTPVVPVECATPRQMYCRRKRLLSLLRVRASERRRLRERLRRLAASGQRCGQQAEARLALGHCARRRAGYPNRCALPTNDSVDFVGAPYRASLGQGGAAQDGRDKCRIDENKCRMVSLQWEMTGTASASRWPKCGTPIAVITAFNTLGRKASAPSQQGLGQQMAR